MQHLEYINKEETETEIVEKNVLALGEAMYDSIDISNDRIIDITPIDKGNHVQKFIISTGKGKKFDVEIISTA